MKYGKGFGFRGYILIKMIQKIDKELEKDQTLILVSSPKHESIWTHASMLACLTCVFVCLVV